MPKISQDRIGLYLKTTLEILSENDGQMPMRELLSEMENRLDFSEHEKARYEKSGYVRWQSVLHFYSINAKKAGWLRKKGGVWYLTPEGESAASLSPLEAFKESERAYKEWDKARNQREAVEQDTAEEVATSAETAFEQAESLAREEIRRFIDDKDAYEFQDLVAALLRSLGYHTPFVAPKGRDGGVDIRAYQDPLGTREPRIKVQVKHRAQKVAVQEVRELSGLLREGEIGLFVSSSGFTSEAVSEMRHSLRHMEKIDLDTLIDMWKDNYDRLDEEDKALLPLREIKFLAP